MLQVDCRSRVVIVLFYRAQIIGIQIALGLVARTWPVMAEPLADQPIPPIVAEPSPTDIAIEDSPLQIPVVIPKIPSQDLPTTPTAPSPSSPPTSESAPKLKSPIKLEEFQTNFRVESDRFTKGQFQVIFDGNLNYKVDDLNRFSIGTGTGYFEHPDVDPVFNIPLKLNWQRRLQPFNVEVGAGLDWFDRLPVTPNLSLKVDTSLFKGFGFSISAEHSIWKPSAKILEDQIMISQVGPGFYWQIDPKSYLFGSARWAGMSDGNQRFVSFGRYERKMGAVVVGANLFALSFQKDRDDRYFSPPDFLSYNGEIGLEGNLFKGLKCRLSGSYGFSRNRGDVDPDTNVTSRCQVDMSPKSNVDFGYNFGLQTFDVKFKSRF
jgi:hypothetical protein